MLYVGMDVVALFTFAVLLCIGVMIALNVLDVDEDTSITIVGCVVSTSTSIVVFYLAMCIFL